jgi:hypothetical protein
MMAARAAPELLLVVGLDREGKQMKSGIVGLLGSLCFALALGCGSAGNFEEEESVGSVQQPLDPSSFTNFTEIFAGGSANPMSVGWGPAIVSNGNVFDVFARDTDAQFYRVKSTNGTYGSWGKVVPNTNTVFTSKPSATLATHNNALIVAGRANGCLMVAVQNGAPLAFTGYVCIGGSDNLFSAPAVAYGAAKIFLLGRTASGPTAGSIKVAINQYQQDGVYRTSQWGGFLTIAGTQSAVRDPAAVWVGNKLIVAFRNSSNQFITGTLTNNGGSYSLTDTVSHGTETNTFSPALAASSSNKVHLFKIGADSRMHVKSSSNGGLTWDSWQSIHFATWVSDPAASASVLPLQVAAQNGNGNGIWTAKHTSP